MKHLVSFKELGLETVDPVLQLLVELTVLTVSGQDPIHLSPTKEFLVLFVCDGQQNKFRKVAVNKETA